MKFASYLSIAAAVALSAASLADAATFCVKDALALKIALTNAQANGEDDVIQMQTGTFTPSGASFVYQSSEAHSLTIVGGFNVGCALGLIGADYTKIDGAGVKAPLSIDATAAEASVSISNLTLQNAVSVGAAAPLHLAGMGGVGVENVIVRANQVDGFAADLSSSNGSVQIRNSVFVDNTAIGDLAGAVGVFSSAGLDPAIVFNNNTIAANVGMVGALVAGSGNATISNNALWNNGGTDLVSIGSGLRDLTNNDYSTRSGNTNTDINALHVDPLFMAAGDFRLRANSLLRDAGDNGVIGGIGMWDASGQARLISTSVDIGAYEVPDVIFQDDFEQQPTE
ncbi:MAG: choice-of-anchor Q domain-containing protein [Dokdonella sp.]